MIHYSTHLYLCIFIFTFLGIPFLIFYNAPHFYIYLSFITFYNCFYLSSLQLQTYYPIIFYAGVLHIVQILITTFSIYSSRSSFPTYWSYNFPTTEYTLFLSLYVEIQCFYYISYWSYYFLFFYVFFLITTCPRCSSRHYEFLPILYLY